MLAGYVAGGLQFALEGGGAFIQLDGHGAVVDLIGDGKGGINCNTACICGSGILYGSDRIK